MKLLSILFVSFLVGLGYASGGAFSLNVVATGARLTGPAGHRAALLKHGRYVSPELDAAANDPSTLIEAYKKLLSPSELIELEKESSPSSSGSTTASGSIMHDYTVPLTIGTSQLQLLVDTGSSDLWVLSDRLPKNLTSGHELYNTSSGTAVKGYSWKIVYGEGTSASGVVYRDSVHVGAATATSQAIEVATAISSRNAFGKASDGVLGLGWEKLNSVKPDKQPPLWRTMDPILKEKVFAVDFQYPTGGTLDFGYVNSSRYNGSLTYTPVFLKSYWGFNYTEFAVGNETYTPLSYPTGHKGEGIIDTGTSFLLLSYLAADPYWKQVKGAKKVGYHWVLPCSSKTVEFGIKIGSKFFYANEKALKQPLGSGICYGGIQAEYYTKYETGDIIGLPFILGNYIVFDGAASRMGFGQRYDE